ncbi:MAG: hypothetical protein Alis2KO_12780 [Aliiglaciecola sp.]
MKKSAPYLIELSTKALAFVTSILLASTLVVADFGEYTFVRSFVLVASTLLLFGLQTSAFKFANQSYALKSHYTRFCVVFIFIGGAVFYALFGFFGTTFLQKFTQPIGDFIQYLVAFGLMNVFFTVYCKAIGKPLLGFLFAFFIVFGFSVSVGVTYLFFEITLTSSLTQFMWVNGIAFASAVAILIAYAGNTRPSKQKWPVRHWLSVSSSMWLSGFLPVFLLQGLVIIFGFYFDQQLLGYLGMAILVVSNLAMFKEVSISLYLPRLINQFSQHQRLNQALLFRCMLLGTVPVLMILLSLRLLETTLLGWFDEKLDPVLFDFIYVLGLGQLMMAVYQPIFRFVGAIGEQTMILFISLTLLVLLIVAYGYFGATQNALLMVASSAFVSALATVIGMILFRRKWDNAL